MKDRMVWGVCSLSVFLKTTPALQGALDRVNAQKLSLSDSVSGACVYVCVRVCVKVL